MFISRNHLVEVARDLRSEHGENPEYDRALVELVCYASGQNTDEHRESVEAELRIVKAVES